MRHVFITLVFTVLVNLIHAQIPKNPCAENIEIFPSSYCYLDSIQFVSYPVPDSNKTVTYMVNNDTVNTFDSLGILSPGTHNLIAIVETDSCWYSDTVTVQITDPPTPLIEEYYITNLEVEFNTTGAYSSFFWTVDGVLQSLDSTMTYTFQNDSTYQVCLGVYFNNCYKDTCYFIGFGSSVSVEETAVSEITIYPNPATEILAIRSDLVDIETLKISDLSGRTVYAERLNGVAYKEVIIEGFPKGVYTVRINDRIFRRVIFQ